LAWTPPAGYTITVPSAKVIFVTMHADATYVTGAFRAGASGYVLKQCASMELLNAVHEVLKGRTYVTPLIRKDILGQLPGLAARVWGDLGRTKRTASGKWCKLVAEGHSVKEIAAILNISRKTVAFHKSECDAKTGHSQHCRIDEIRSGARHHRILTSLGGRAIPEHPFPESRTRHLPSSAG